jgi:hypothetical protein
MVFPPSTAALHGPRWAVGALWVEEGAGSGYALGLLELPMPRPSATAIFLLTGALAGASPAAGAPLLRVVAVGDTGKTFAETCGAPGDIAAARICADQHALLRAHLAALSPAADVVLATGDLFYGTSATPPAYRNGLRRFWGRWGRTPVLPMRGNHDLSEDVKAATQPKVAALLAASFPLPTDAPWQRVPCSPGADDGGDAARLCYAGEKDGICLVTGDSANVEDIRLPEWPASCTWKIAGLHHPPATSFEKKKEIAGVASVLAARAPDLVIAGHAHHMEGIVAEGGGGTVPVRMVTVVSGTGSERRFPSEPLTLADGTVAAISVDAAGEGAAGRTATGLAPAYVYADFGYTVVDVYADHLLVRPILLRGTEVHGAPCWRWNKGGTALVSASCDAE